MGLRRSGGANYVTVIGTVTDNGHTLKRVDGGNKRDVLWILENDDGQSLYASTEDGVLSLPVLLVPKTVRVGMSRLTEWQPSHVLTVGRFRLSGG